MPLLFLEEYRHFENGENMIDLLTPNLFLCMLKRVVLYLRLLVQNCTDLKYDY